MIFYSSKFLNLITVFTKSFKLKTTVFTEFRILSIVLIGLNVNLFAQSVQPPSFSHSSGFYSGVFSLNILAENPNDIILYTLDGSEPKIDNLTGKEWVYKLSYKTYPEDSHGQLISDTLWTHEYIGPILIEDISNEPDRIADISTSYMTNDWYYQNSKVLETPVYKGVCLRVVAYRNGVYSEEVTKNYFIGDVDKYSIPIVCLAIDPDQFYSFEEGINVPGIDFETWRNQNPGLTFENFQDIFGASGNFRRKGINTELKINFTYLVEGNVVLNHGAGIRINGNASRFYPNRSLRLYAKNNYGPKEFEYPFFNNLNEDKFRRLILRNAGNDTESSLLRDAFVHVASDELNVVTQGYQPTIVFINGEYHGLYNLRERFDKKFFDQHFGIHEDSLDYIKENNAKEGNTIAFEELFHFLQNNDLTDDSVLKELSYRVDLDNLIDFYIAETYMGNWDWPSNNHELFRKQVDFDSTAAFGNDGRWRFLLKDLDASLGIAAHQADYTKNDFEQFRTASGNTALDHLILPFVYAMKNSQFKHRFVNRYCDMMNSIYKTDVLKNKLNEISDVIRPEIKESTHRWNPYNYLLFYWPIHSLNNWEQEINVIYEYLDNRTYWTRKHLNEEYSLGDEKEIILDVSENDGGIVYINSLKIDEELDGVNQGAIYPWKGVYYSEVPLVLKAEAKEGYIFSHWSGKIKSWLKEITVKIDDVYYIKANFKRIGEDELVSDGITVFPNPFSNSITIYADRYDGIYNVISANGKVVAQGVLTSSQIDLQELNSGVYFFNLIYGEEVIRKKLLKFTD